MHRDWLPVLGGVFVALLCVCVFAMAYTMDHSGGLEACIGEEEMASTPLLSVQPSWTDGTSPSQPDTEQNTSEPSVTQPPATTRPTEGTEPPATTRPTEATEPPTTTEPTENTEPAETVPETTQTPATTTPGVPDVLLSYAEFMALSEAEQQAYFESFADPAAYIAWFNQAKAEYDASKDDIVIEGGGNLDIGDIIGGGN